MIYRATKISMLSAALALSALSVAVAQVGGGVTPPADDPVANLSRTLSQVDALIGGGEGSEGSEDGAAVQRLSGVTQITTEGAASEEIEVWAEAQRSSQRGESGLEFRATYDRKFGSGSDDFYDDLYSYKNRFDAVLTWNILKSGLIGRSQSEQEVAFEREAMLLEELSAMNEGQIRSEVIAQGELLDGYRNRVYTTQIEIYEALHELLIKLIRQGQATSMDMSQVEIESRIAEGSLRQTPIEVTALLNSKHYLEAQTRIEQQMVESLTQGSISLKQSRLNEQVVEHEAGSVRIWDRASLAPYAKAQHYSDTGFSASRVTAHLGVSATLPLFSGVKNRRAEVEARSTLAAKATQRGELSQSQQIGECASQLNRNLERLKSSVMLEELYREQIKVARDAYLHKQLTISELAQHYIKLLALQAELIQIIEDREMMKAKLLLTTI